MGSSINDIVIADVIGVGPNGPQPVTAVGLVLNDGRTVWGDCVGADAETAKTAVRRTVKPVLLGHHVTRFTDTMGKLADLTHPVTRHLPMDEPVPDTVEKPKSSSRRQMLKLLTTGDSGDTDAIPPTQKPPTRPVTTAEPLPPGVLYGLSQAAWRADTRPPAEKAADLGASNRRPRANLPLLAAVDDATDGPLRAATAVLAYALPPDSDPADLLGTEAEKLQQYVRRLTQWIARTPHHRPAVLLDLRGALGQLYRQDVGKVLGALVGLSHAARPYKLWVVDATTDTEAAMELKTFIRMRQMAVRLGTADPQRSAAAHGVVVSPAAVGGWVNMGAIHQAAADDEVEMIWWPRGPETVCSATLMLSLARYLHPTAVGGGPGVAGLAAAVSQTRRWMRIPGRP